MSDIATANGGIPIPPPPEETPAPTKPPEPALSAPPSDAEFDFSAALLRLLVGAALEGTDELRARLRQWEATVRATSPTSVPGGASLSDTPSDRLRYAGVGMLFESPAWMRRGMYALARLSGAAACVCYVALAPALQRWPFDNVELLIDDLLVDWSDRVDRWAATGRVEEREARLMARTALPGVIDELLDVLTKNPEVRELVAQQGTTLAGTAVQEMRERAGSADVLAERIMHGLLRRPAGTLPRRSQAPAQPAAPPAAQPGGAPTPGPNGSP